MFFKNIGLLIGYPRVTMIDFHYAALCVAMFMYKGLFSLKTMKSFIYALICVLVLTSGLSAQQLTGSLNAIVVDKSGAVVPNAKVTVTNEASGDVRRATSNGEGFFSIQGIFPGSYTVSVEAAGFKTYKVQKVYFNPGDRRTLPDVELEVGATSEQVTVSDQLEDLTPVDSGEKAVVISQKQLQNVAIVGRSAAEFLKVLPGLAPVTGMQNRPAFNGENIGINGNGEGGKQSAIGNFSANGGRTSALVINADGAQVDDPGCNCATSVNPNPDMIAEMKVQTSNFGAENARGPVVINTITKGGGKDFHGTAYFIARHFSMNSNDSENKALGLKRPENKYYFPGFNIGGPVLIPGTGFNKNRDKLFFFAGFEAFRQTIDSGVITAITPTDAMRQGDFTNTAYLNSINSVYGKFAPLNQENFPGNRIPAAQLDRSWVNYTRLFPQPNLDPNNASLRGQNYAQVLTLQQNMTQATGRVDYNISDYTKLFVRYNRQREVQPFPIQLWWRNAGAVPLPTPIEGKNQSQSLASTFTKVFSPTVTNEFVFGYTFIDFPNEYQDYSKMTRAANNYAYRGIFKQDDKIPGTISWGTPVASMWMTGGFDPVLFATKHQTSFNNNFSKVFSTHTIKAGGFYQYVINKQPGNEPSPGFGYFDTWGGNSSGNLFGDMVRGAAAIYEEQSRQTVRDMGWYELSGYIQDNWKVNRRLTLDLGMRIQRMQPWTARNGIGNATWLPRAYSATAAGSTFPGILWNQRDSAVSLSGYPMRGAFLAPRFGMAYDLFGNGKTILRGGWGRFVFHDSQLASGVMDLPAGVRRSSQCCGVSIAAMDALNTGDLVFGGLAYDGLDNRQPITDNYSFTISQRLPGRQLLEVAYVGSNSKDLVNEGFQNINLVPVGALINDPTADANAFRPLRQYQDLNIVSHNVQSNFNSMQVTLAKQTGIFNYTFAYTWSKAMGLSNTGDQFNRTNVYGPLNFDRTHNFSNTYVVNVPDLVKGGNKFAKGVVNGWQISGIVQMYSGVNLQANGSSNFNLAVPQTYYNRFFPGRFEGTGNIGGSFITGTNAISLQPILTCNPTQGNPSGRYINPDCFAPPMVGAPGRLGQNGAMVFPLLRGPGFFNTDLSLMKNFRFSEAKNIQFRASAYNLPNHPNLSFRGSGDPSLQLTYDAQGRLTTPNFGVPTATLGRRNVQLQIKFFF
jgi:hypothetical protein